jgi:Fe-S cluster assembly ATPase SufC
MIAGALPPTGGRVVFDGQDISSLATREIFHRGIVRTFQIPHEFGRLTVLANLMVVPAAQTGEDLFRINVKKKTIMTLTYPWGMVSCDVTGDSHARRIEAHRKGHAKRRGRARLP